MINNTLNGLAIWRPTLLLNEHATFAVVVNTVDGPKKPAKPKIYVFTYMSSNTLLITG